VLHPFVWLVLCGVWLAVRKATGKASLASLAIALGLPIGVAAGGFERWELAASAALAALVMLRHVDNIRRLIGGKELSADKTG
jgi:glycerol-3-phosphate acyltransferase PlsY